MPLHRPVMVTGCPRSGKSCIAKILSKSDEFAWISEPLMIWDQGLHREPHDERGAADASPSLRAAIERGIDEVLAERADRRYLDDLSHHCLRLPFLHALVPEAKVIHVVRRPDDAIPEMVYGWSFRDTVKGAIARRKHSIRLRTLPRHAWRFAKNRVARSVQGRRQTWGPRVRGMPAFAPGKSVPEIAAFQWMTMIETAQRGLESLPAAQRLDVRYEDLRHDTGRVARQIAEFLAVEDPDALVAHAEAFMDPAFVFEKKIAPTPDEWDRVNALIKPLRSRLGYPPQPVVADLADAAETAAQPV